MGIKKLKEENKELAIVNSIAQHLNKMLSLKEALNGVLEQIIVPFRLKTAWVWLLRTKDEASYLAAAINLPPIFVEQPELLNGSCYCIKKYLTENWNDASNISEITCSRLKNLTSGTDGLRYHASIPLRTEDKKLGILNVVSQDSQKLSEQQLQLLYTVGDMLSIAIERAQLFEQSQALGVMEERNRLAREIHDTLAQGLSAIALRLNVIELLLKKHPIDERIQKQLSGEVQQVMKLTQENLKEARNSVLDLRATPLQNQDLPIALENFVIQKCKEHHLDGQFSTLGVVQKVGMRTAMCLYRVTQEALNNVLKHAKAKWVNVQLSYDVEELILKIEDDGVGFNAASISSNGFGLIGMNERVKLVGGKFQIKSIEGGGTKIFVVVPLV